MVLSWAQYHKRILFITILVLTSSNPYSVHAIQSYQSQYTTKPSIIDGDATFQEWSGAEEIWNSVGLLQVKNDGTHLYILVDVLKDTVEDEILPLGEDGDSVFIAFDTNIDSKISSDDIEFSFDSLSQDICFSRFIGPQEWTESSKSVRSELVPGYGSTPNKIDPHRFWEVSINLDEIIADYRNQIRIGIEINSASPEFGYQTPAEYTRDFTELLEIQLQKPPQEFNRLISSTVCNPIKIDGYITDPKEWDNSKPIHLTLTNTEGPPGTYTATVWAKNNDKHLYLLVVAETDLSRYSDENGVGVIYRWQDKDTAHMYYDESTVFLDGTTTDWCDLPTGIWEHDTHPISKGRNNVYAKGRYDGSRYWFEISKPLDSGDSCDWVLEPGVTIGSGQDSLYLVFWDMDSENIEFTAPLILNLYSDPTISPTKIVYDEKPVDKTSVTSDYKETIQSLQMKTLALFRRFSQPILFSTTVFCLVASILWFSWQGSIINIPYTGEIDIHTFASRTGKKVSKVESVINDAVENGEVAGYYTIDRKKFVPVDVLKSKIRDILFSDYNN